MSKNRRAYHTIANKSTWTDQSIIIEVYWSRDGEKENEVVIIEKFCRDTGM
jgi:hypothetical protein